MSQAAIERATVHEVEAVYTSGHVNTTGDRVELSPMPVMPILILPILAAQSLCHADAYATFPVNLGPYPH